MTVRRISGSGKRLWMCTAGLVLCASLLSTIDAAGSAALSLSDFADYRVWQRDIGGTSRRIQIKGSAGFESGDRIEARILRHQESTVIVPWTDISAVFTGTEFVGTITVPQGGWYNTEVRLIDAEGSVQSITRGSNKWGVGMIILTIGQSNMSECGNRPYTEANDLAVNYSNMGIWEHLKDPYDYPSPPGAVDSDNHVLDWGWHAMGSMVPALANALLETYRFPIAFIPAAKGGTNLFWDWARNNADPLDTNTLYGYSVTKALRAGGIELIVMHQGESDVFSRRTQSEYETDIRNLIDFYRKDLNIPDLPLFLCQLGTMEPGVLGSTDQEMMEIRNAQHAVDDGKSIFTAATAMDLPRMDVVHLDVPQLGKLAQRIANAIKYYYGDAAYYRGPGITKAFFGNSRDQITIKIEHQGGTDFFPHSAITGFDALVSNQALPITSASRIGPDLIRLNLASPVPADATCTVRYLFGQNPNVSGLVKDNTPLGLPMEATLRPLQVTSTELPLVSITAPHPQAMEEGTRPGQFAVSRDLTAGDLTVYYSISGTAKNGSDYREIPTSVQFTGGQSIAHIDIIPIDDNQPEVDETVVLTLLPNPAYQVRQPYSAEITIIDNEPPAPLVGVRTGKAWAWENGSGNGSFIVSRTMPEIGIVVNYTVSGTAQNGIDYIELSGSVAVPAGHESVEIAVRALDDGLREGTETVILTLTEQISYALNPSSISATVKIRDSDAEEFVWNSWNATVRTDVPEALLQDESGSLPVRLIVYQSATPFDVDFGSTLRNYNAGEHSQWWARLAPGYWSGLNPGEDFPFFGKSLYPRGAEHGELFPPQPLGVYDFEMHAANSDQLMVAAFIVPADGEYTISNLAVRRAHWDGATVRYRVFDNARNQIESMRASTNRAWIQSDEEFELGSVRAGDTLYFALDREGCWGWDATEIVFTVSALLTGRRPSVTLSSPLDGFQFEPGQPIVVEAEASDEDGSIVLVEFYANGNKIGQTSTAPYQFTWTGVPGGTYTLTARALDNDGIPAVSEPVVVSVPLTHISITALTPEIPEQGPEMGRFAVHRTTTNGALLVTYSVSGTALSGTDFTALSGSISFLDGQSVAYIDLQVIDDNDPEDDETVIVTVHPGEAYHLGSPDNATITIIDNEPKWPFVSVASTIPDASEQGPTNGEFTISRSHGHGTITVQYALSGTATNGVDYLIENGSVEMPDGILQVVIPVNVIDDDEAEGDETVILTLAAGENYYRGAPASATVTITDDDVISISWNSYDVTIRSEAPQAQVTSGSHTAYLDFYLSADEYGVERGDTPSYYSGSHINSTWELSPGYWAWPFWLGANDWAIPFYGKNAFGRQQSEGNTPLPLGAFDLEVHPPDNERLSVVAFIAPIQGIYEVSNLAARRVCHDGWKAELRLFNKDKTLLDKMIAANDKKWVTSSMTHRLGALEAGDTIYFAAYRGEGDHWGWDALEMAWTVTCFAPKKDVGPIVPVVSVRALDAQASEAGPDNGAFSVTRDIARGNLTVFYTVSGSAQNGIDYEYLSGSVIIPHGETEAIIPVRVIDDDLSEGDETVTVTLNADAGYIIGTAVATVVIADNNVVDFIWNSYDAVIRPQAPHAEIAEVSGASAASLEFYLSSNDNGIDRGDIPAFYPGAHVFDWLWQLSPDYWAWPFWIGTTDFAIPFCGKNREARSASEGNTSVPEGVFDLMVHPPDDERLMVTAFIAPTAGIYSVHNLAARRIHGGTADLKLFNTGKQLLETVTAGSTMWAQSAQTHYLGTLDQGDTIYFAADRGADNSWSMDALEIAWTVRCQVPRKPDATDDRASTDEGRAVSISVLSNDSDPGAEALIVTAVSDPANGIAVINPDYTITYTPNPGFFGNDEFQYTVMDAGRGWTTATARVFVNGLPSARLLTPLSTASFSESDVVFLTAEASDPDGSISLVRYYAGSNLIGSSASAPYAVIWESAPVGAHELIVEAIDDKGAVALSVPVRISVESFGSDAYYEIDGMCMMEAENFMQNNTRSDVTAWEFGRGGKQYSGAGYMVTPDGSAAEGTYVSSAELLYRVNITTPGVYHLAVRRMAPDADDDSGLLGVNNSAVGTTHFAGTATTWQWVHANTGLGYLGRGMHTIRLRRSEDGFMVDRIMIATGKATNRLPKNGSKAMGPEESPRK